MVVSIGLAAFLFTGLAAVLASGLRTLGVERGRTQANEIATQGIEDLQRFPFNNLGLCSTPPPPPPGGTVPLSIGTNPTVVLDCTNYSPEEPCTPTAFSPAIGVYPVPVSQYTCNRHNTNFVVTRYVNWGDSPTNTIKQLAVTVDWTDTVGRHQIAEQSALRAAEAAAAVGSAPPQFSSSLGRPNVQPSQVWVNSSGYLVDSNGNPQPLTLTATTQGLLTTDLVQASFIYYLIDPTTGLPSQKVFYLTLSSTGANTWAGTIPGAGQAGAVQFSPAGGSEYITFSLVRASDGRANSVVFYPAITLCANSNCSVNASNPTVSGTASSPVQLASDGSIFLTTPPAAPNVLTLNATTTNLYVSTSSVDSVTATLQTVSGATSIALQPGPSCLPLTSTATACNSWTGTVTRSNGYLFPVGSQFIYFTAQQLGANPATLNPSTAAAQSNSVSFT